MKASPYVIMTLATILIISVAADTRGEDEGGWSDLNAPDGNTVDKLIIQQPRSLDDDEPPAMPKPKPKPPKAKPQPAPAPADGPCVANAPVALKDSSGSSYDMLYFTPYPAGKAYTYNLSPGTGFSARIVAKPDYASRRLGHVETRGAQLIYTTPQPEDTFEGVLQIRSTSDPSICRAVPIRIESGGCVQAGTKVTMVDGSKQDIERIKPGDRILAFDKDAGKLSEAAVEKLLVHDEITYIMHELVPDKGAPLVVTGNHPVLVKGRGWQHIDSIKPGDVIFQRDNSSGMLGEVTVASIIRDKSEQGTVYNLKTSRGSYIANDILIHNKCLAQGTLIDTPAGRRPIEGILPGDMVMGSVAGKITPVKVTNVYAKDTILPELPGKRLSDKVIATVNHLVVTSGTLKIAGEMPAPDEKIAGTVYDIRTDAGNYMADGLIMVTAD